MEHVISVSNKQTNEQSALYEAARRGDVRALEHLLQQNALILDNIPDDGRETPLHISAVLNHASFTEALLNRNRDLATRQDSAGRTALHLASAEDNLEAVQTLLEFNGEPCLVANREGRLPLHYAAMRGRPQVVEALVIARPDSLGCLDQQGNSVFHLCVIYNHFKTLQALVKLHYATTDVTAGAPRAPSFALVDRAENTILHLAIMYERDEAVRYLLSIPEIRELGKTKNKDGLTPLDILERSPKDWKIKEIKLMLTKSDTEESETSMSKSRMILKWMGRQLKRGVDTSWIEEVRGNLSAASIFMASVTFQALINPPGSFIQQDLAKQEDAPSPSGALNCVPTDDNKELCPGQAVSSFRRQGEFLSYAACITISFYASLSVTLLLVSGVPLRNSAAIWILAISMSLSVLSLAVAYNIAVYMLVYSGGYLRPVAVWAFLLWTCGFVLPLVLLTQCAFSSGLPIRLPTNVVRRITGSEQVAAAALYLPINASCCRQ
ncbi:ankyrin repeat-containing protein ITN1-like [Neltuma alba]|uniref:ankyrin repeat-containing protein ITN1-like n=1 Tax=Neltuma alba TaxID=207710 RepID=UPI0010A314F3|nr:ankyrin repeat-containing protein ITN1-like [Prosopis alba]